GHAAPRLLSARDPRRRHPPLAPRGPGTLARGGAAQVTVAGGSGLVVDARRSGTGRRGAGRIQACPGVAADAPRARSSREAADVAGFAAACDGALAGVVAHAADAADLALAADRGGARTSFRPACDRARLGRRARHASVAGAGVVLDAAHVAR